MLALYNVKLSRQGLSALTTVVRYSTGSPSQHNEARRGNERHTNQWRRLNCRPPPFLDNMIFYVKNPEASPKKQ